MVRLVARDKPQVPRKHSSRNTSVRRYTWGLPYRYMVNTTVSDASTGVISLTIQI